jgi:tetratricopeptide (TPR) repeat protein
MHNYFASSIQTHQRFARILVMTIFCWAMIFLTLSAQQPKKSKVYQKMIAAYDKHEFEKAYEYGTQALKKEKNNYHIYVIRGYSAAFLNQCALGLADAEMALKLNPGHLHSILLKGLCLDCLDRIEEIEPQAKQAQLDFPARYEPLYLRYKVAFQQRKLEEAKSFLLKAIELDTSHIVMFDDLSALYLEMEQPQKALDAVQIAIRRQGGVSPKTLKKRCTAYFLLNQYRESIADLYLANKLKYDLGQHEVQLATCYHQLHQKDSTQKYLQLAYQKNQNNIPILALLFDLNQTWKNYEQCLKIISQILSIDSSNPTHHLRKGFTLMKCRHDGQGISDFNRAIALEPNNFGFYADRTWYYVKYYQYARALKDIDTAARLSPNNPMLLNNYAFVNNFLGRYRAATDSATRAIGLQPDMAYAYNNRGYAYGKLGKTDSAFRDFERSMALDSANAMLFSYRGQIYYDLKQYDRAAKDFQKALQLDSSRVEIYFRLARATFTLGQQKAAFLYLEQALNKVPIYNDVIALRAIFYLEQNQPEKACATWQMAKDQPFMYLDFQKEAMERFKNVCR